MTENQQQFTIRNIWLMFNKTKKGQPQLTLVQPTTNNH
jgi:hypothetical protein